MYINSVYIKKYKILEDLKIEFQIPKNNENVVNVISGVNGCGKSTLLEYLYPIISNYKIMQRAYNNYACSTTITSSGKNILNGEFVVNDKNIDKSNYSEYQEYIKSIEKENQYINGIHSSPRVIYIPSNMLFGYTPKSELDINYKFSNTVNTSQILADAELYIKNYIISKVMSSEEEKSNKQIKKEAIEEFNSIFKNCDLVTKLIDLDIHNNNRPVFETINGDRVTIEKLSSGEQQLYARVVSLMILNPHNSIILIDEPEIALHPKWQIEIMKIYSSIGENNQFIVTTHSPHIIADTHLNNLILLVKEDNKIVAKQPKHSPIGFERDLNSITKMLMGADYTPSWLNKIKKEYRELVENGEIESEKAKSLREKIIEYEDENSKYMQKINFYVDLHS